MQGCVNVKNYCSQIMPPLKHHCYLKHRRESTANLARLTMRTEDAAALHLILILLMCSLARKNIGEFGLDLLMTVQLQARILQNFVLVIVVTEETAWTTVTAL